MSTAITEVQSETAYDAMQDGMPLVVRLVSRPATFDELLQVEPRLPRAVVERRLLRLIRTGLVREESGRYEAVARVVQQTRQEGIITSLSRYVLPMFTHLVRDPERAFVTQIDLHLPLEEQRSLRHGPIQELLLKIDALTDEATHDSRPGMCVVVGTSDLPPPGDTGERLLETVRRSARQRSTASLADRAILTQQDAYFSIDAFPKAEALVRELAETLSSRRAGSQKPNYTLALAFGAREDQEVAT